MAADSDLVFGENDRPRRILTKEEALACTSVKAMREMIEMDAVFMYEHMDGSVRVGLTRKGFAIIGRKPEDGDITNVVVERKKGG